MASEPVETAAGPCDRTDPTDPGMVCSLVAGALVGVMAQVIRAGDWHEATTVASYGFAIGQGLSLPLIVVMPLLPYLDRTRAVEEIDATARHVRRIRDRILHPPYATAAAAGYLFASQVVIVGMERWLPDATVENHPGVVLFAVTIMMALLLGYALGADPYSRSRVREAG